MTFQHTLTRHPWTILVIVVAIAGLSVASDGMQSQRPKKPAVTPLPSNWEQWRESVPVSGGLRVGVMNDAALRFDPTQFTVWLPVTKAPALCVEIASQDGRYVASLPYDIQGGKPGPLPLEFPPSKHTAQLSKFEPGQIAILARLAENCGATPERPSQFVVAGWSKQQQIGNVVVLLNSRLPTSIVAGAGSAVDAEYRCTSIAGEATAFNLRCEIPAKDLPLGRKYVIRMRRASGASSGPGVELPLAVPK